MTELFIEKGVEIPMLRGRNQWGEEYFYIHGKWNIIRQMEPGDSIFVPDVTPSSLRSRVKKITTRLREENPDIRFAIRAVEGGSRLWRTN